MLPPFKEYCSLLAGLPEHYPVILSATLSAYTIGPFTAEVTGQLIFAAGYTLDVWELLDLSTGVIRSYSYELDQAEKRIWWYDPMEHPENPVLQSSFPQHKHIYPNIKQNRVPAPDISFTEPNLPFLIQEVEALLAGQNR